MLHEEAWWQLCMVAYTQLYLARELAQNIPSPWGKYLPSNNASIRSPSQVQKDFERIIGTIGTPAQPPKPLKNVRRQLPCPVDDNYLGRFITR